MYPIILTNQSSTVPTDIYYMPKGAEKNLEKVPEDVGRWRWNGYLIGCRSVKIQ